MADGLKTSIGTNRQSGSCFSNGASSAGADDKTTGKYGTATILQETIIHLTGADKKLNCGIHYKFNNKGVSDLLKDKEIVLKADEDSGTLKLENMGGKTSSADISKYLPSAFKK
ncbi:hypothetical protein MOMA_05325 [Moraxella macacae 0408225]|uniref:Uncharacterized protein n=1 Tax=Moraxella macacae 0408225 TaxID=1230338 RepID=L2F9T2_9GAMM|nr:hypothetical protein MOMA_05325 [Moraxella macacae 0408225]